MIVSREQSTNKSLDLTQYWDQFSLLTESGEVCRGSARPLAERGAQTGAGAHGAPGADTPLSGDWSHCWLRAASTGAQLGVLLDTGQFGAGRLQEVVDGVLALHGRNLG